MPEAGRTPDAAFKRGGNDLAYGQANALNSLTGLVGPVEQPEPYAPSGDEEEFLYAQTDRPEEPLTQGVPVGPGAPTTRHAYVSDEDLAVRVARQASADPAAPKSIRKWAARALEGF